MKFAFDDEEELKAFNLKLVQVKQALCPGRPLNDLKFFKLLLERFESQENLNYKIPGIERLAQTLSGSKFNPRSGQL